MFKFFSMVWSFSWEALLGKQTFIEALRNNKAKLIFVVIMSVSLTTNYYLAGKLAILGRDHVELQRSYDAVVKPKQTELPVKDKPIPSTITAKDKTGTSQHRDKSVPPPTSVEGVEKQLVMDTLKNLHVE